MGARTTCRIFKSDNTLALYFKLTFTMTHHFHLFDGSIEKTDVSFSLQVDDFSRLWNLLCLVSHSRYQCPGQSGRSTSPKTAVFCTSMQTTATTNALEVLKLLWLRWVPSKDSFIPHLQADKHTIHNTFPVDSKVLPPFGAQSPQSGIHSMFLPWSHWRLLQNGGVVCHQWTKAKFFTVRNKGLTATLVHLNVMQSLFAENKKNRISTS